MTPGLIYLHSWVWLNFYSKKINFKCTVWSCGIGGVSLPHCIVKIAGFEQLLKNSFLLKIVLFTLKSVLQIDSVNWKQLQKIEDGLQFSWKRTIFKFFVQFTRTAYANTLSSRMNPFTCYNTPFGALILSHHDSQVWLYL